MATIKGFIRSYGAAVRRAEREQQRRARIAAKRYKQQQRVQEIENASEAVLAYNDYIDLIQSFHKNCTEEINWSGIKATHIPEEPKKLINNEAKAQTELNNFRPSIIDKILGRVNRKIKHFKNLIEKSKVLDEKEYQNELMHYQKELEHWHLYQEMAKGIEEKDIDMYSKVLQYFNPFSDIGELGSQIEFFVSQDFFDINLP